MTLSLLLRFKKKPQKNNSPEQHGVKSYLKIKCDLICLSSLSLAEALAKVKENRNMSDAFQDLFLPNGQAPLSGLFTRRLDLAAILDAVAVKGISEFYGGNLTQEMAAAVRKNVSPPCLTL